MPELCWATHKYPLNHWLTNHGPHRIRDGPPNRVPLRNRQATVVDPLGESQAWHGLSYWFGELLVDFEQNDEFWPGTAGETSCIHFIWFWGFHGKGSWLQKWQSNLGYWINVLVLLRTYVLCPNPNWARRLKSLSDNLWCRVEWWFITESRC